MIEAKLRPYLETSLIQPLARHLPFSPIIATGCGLLFGLLAALFIALHHPFLGVGLLLLSGLFDLLDGSIARMRGQTSQMGAALDILSDRIVEASVVIALFLVNPEARGVLALLMLAAILLCVTSFLVVAIFVTPLIAPKTQTSEALSSQSGGKKKGFHYSVGWMERPEAFLFFIAMALAPAAFAPLAILFTLLVLATAAMRMIQFQGNAL